MQEEKLCGLPSHESFAHNFCIMYEKKGLAWAPKWQTKHLSTIDMLGNLMKFTSYTHDFVSYYPIQQKGVHSIGDHSITTWPRSGR